MNRRSTRRKTDIHSDLLDFDLQRLEQRTMLSSTLQVVARGFEGTEQFQIVLDGQSVGTYEASLEYQTFEYISEDDVTADQVRVEFINDEYDPVAGIDANLQVDYITIDGSTYQTEASDTYSTGTWLPEDGITAGFRESEVLHGNGFFEYRSGQGQGSVIEIRARGEMGTEQFELQLDGSPTRTFDTTTSLETYVYTASTNVTADQVRIRFLNDQYDPENGVDANLFVDSIQIDGVVYQTEWPTTYSTGTWKPEDGITPGNRESEVLHSNGYFQYSSLLLDGEGALRLESSQYFVGEDKSSVSVEIIREDSAQGALAVEYQTFNLTAADGLDYEGVAGTLIFQDGETSKSVVIPVLDDLEDEGEEQFSLVIDNITGNGTLSAPRTTTVTIDDDDASQEYGDGLLGEYFDTPDLTERMGTRVDATVDFDWESGEPIANVASDTFSVRWTGQIKPRYSETYTFTTTSDDGVRLWVNDLLIIDEWNDHDATEHSGQITLEANTRYNIRTEYYDNTGLAVAQLAWSSPSQTLEIIPQGVLFAATDPGTQPDELQNETIVSGLNRPTAIEWTDNGRNLLIAEQHGTIQVVRDGELQATPFIDISDQVNGVRDRGLLDIAVHPDFENNPYVYLLFTYDPPKVADYTGLAGPDGKGNRAGRLIRVTADASTDYTTAVPDSEVVLLGKNSIWDNFNAFANSTSDFDEPPAGIRDDGTNIQDFIASDSESHTVGALAFGNDGSLFVSIGDGTSYNRVDPRTVRVQDIDNLSGKVLRIDPLTGEGLADNPFFNGDAEANRSKVYYLGLRNPFRLTIDPQTGQLFVGDVGWTQWEEVNTGPAGSNFGWPYFEGGSSESLRTGGYQNLPEAQAFYASGQPVVAPIYGLSHSADGINAIVMGDVYRGGNYPSQFEGSLFVNDLGQGIVRAVEIQPDGTAGAVRSFATGANLVVQMTIGPDGNMYYVDLNDNQVGRWTFV